MEAEAEGAPLVHVPRNNLKKLAVSPLKIALAISNNHKNVK